jgi:tight adherence protein C
MVIALALSWSLLVATAAAAMSPTDHRVRSRLPSEPRPVDRSPPSERLGRRLTPARWRLSPTRHSQIGLAVPAAIVGAAVWAPLGVVLGLVAWAIPLGRLRRTERDRRRAVQRDLPDVIDLFILAFGAELNVRLAVETVARSGHGAIVDHLAAALRQADRGQRLHVALGSVADALGDGVRPLLRVLTDTATPPRDRRDQLAVIGIDARLERRRAAEIDARQVPVRLLFPLVIAVLPAFGLLTVVPIVAGSLRAVTG